MHTETLGDPPEGLSNVACEFWERFMRGQTVWIWDAEDMRKFNEVWDACIQRCVERGELG